MENDIKGQKTVISPIFPDMLSLLAYRDTEDMAVSSSFDILWGGTKFIVVSIVIFFFLR